MRRDPGQHLVGCLLTLALLAGCVGAPGAAPAPPTLTQDGPSSPAGAIAEAAVELGSPGSLERRGLRALGDAIGDARVVMLGEPWHGDGGAIRLRSELVGYLHRELGFDVLVFEADLYSLHHGWRTARETGELEPVRNNVPDFWSRTRAADPLWEHVEEGLRSGDTLHVAGLDARMRGELARDSLPADLERHFLSLEGVSVDEARRASGFLAAALGAAEADGSLLNDANHARLLRLLRRLEVELASGGSQPFMAQVAESVRRNLEGEGPDAVMGSNLIWLATHAYPDRKLIVWAHNNHVLTDKWVFFEAPDETLRHEVLAQRTEAQIGHATFLGHEARRYFGSRLYAIATLSHRGRYSTDIASALAGRPSDFTSTADLAPAPPGTLERVISDRGYRVAFVDLRSLEEVPGPVRSRVLDYTQTPPTRLRLHRGWDGVLVLSRTHGLEETGPGR